MCEINASSWFYYKEIRRNEVRVQIPRALYTRYSCDTTLNFTVIQNHKIKRTGPINYLGIFICNSSLLTLKLKHTE
jgi:hypothetical protein